MSRKEVRLNELDNAFVFECPWCDQQVQVLVSDIACCIFRHAVFKENFQQVGPHTGKEECDRLVAEDLVIGCAKPFKLFVGTKPYVEECDYI